MIHIDDEFKSLIPPLSLEESKQLTKNILEEGIREPIILWRNTIIDGHNRYRIAQEYDLDFETKKMEFESRSHVKLWMIDNQFGRRNLKLQDRAELAIQYEIIETALAKIRQIEGAKGQSPVTEAGNARDKAAKKAGVSSGYVAQHKKIKKELEENKDNKEIVKVATAYLNKEEGVNQKKALEDIKQAKEKVEKTKLRAEVAETAKAAQDDPTKIPPVSLIYADPPWRYTPAEETRQVENHYPTMSDQEIIDLGSKIKTNKDCVLYMWATSGKLPLVFDVIKEWGFTYKSSMVWDKETLGMGYWCRGQHELLIIATKGHISPPDQPDRISSVYREAKTKHSKKPLFFAEYLEKVYGHLDKVELFTRETRDGWIPFGNQY